MFGQINTRKDLPHYGYPSIEQFRTVIHNVNHKAHYVGQDENGDAIYDQTRQKPTLKFIGTTKLHGTNCAVVIDIKNEIVYFQSRDNVITPAEDNAGAATYLASIQQDIVNMVKEVIQEEFYANEVYNFTILETMHKEDKNTFDTIVIYGEWCGGSIQKGVALNGLDKMFVVFDVAFIDSTAEIKHKRWKSYDFVQRIKLPSKRVYNILDYKVWDIDIDFKAPTLSQNDLIDITTEVEAHCPVGLAFGKDGIGEGVVWKCITPPYDGDSGYWMKVKGEKHSSSKVKTIAAVDVEKVRNVIEFVDNVVTESRCLQSIDKLREAGKPLTRASLGDYLRWIFNDIVKEETDTMVANGIEAKAVGGAISNKAREWFFANELNF